MKAVTIYHNPRCGKSREALRLIEEAGAKVTVVEYLRTPLGDKELDALCRKLEVEPTAILRFKEPIARELRLSADDQRTRAEWLKLIAGHPVLMERPIVVCGTKAVVGRPPEAVQSLLT
jgi:arsenate reductase